MRISSWRILRFASMLVLFACECARSQVAAAPSPPPEEAQKNSPWRLAAKTYQVEEIDLYAIAFQESRRRRSDGQYRAWPWTLNSPSTGPLFFETYEAAAQKLEAIIESGERNVDIGLMGVSWRY